MRKPKLIAADNVRRHLIHEAKSFLTIAPDNAVWETCSASAAPYCQDGFVRIQPPHDASDDVVEMLKSIYVGRRCIVTVQPRQRTSPIPNRDLPPTTTTIRETVLALVSQSTVSDKESLTSLAERHLAKVGL